MQQYMKLCMTYVYNWMTNSQALCISNTYSISQNFIFGQIHFFVNPFLLDFHSQNQEPASFIGNNRHACAINSCKSYPDFFQLWLNGSWLQTNALQKQKQSKPRQNQIIPLVQNSCFPYWNPSKNCKKQVHKDYPLAAPAICNHKSTCALAVKNNLCGSHVFLFEF